MTSMHKNPVVACDLGFHSYCRISRNVRFRQAACEHRPAWIITSHDKGVTWNLTATPTDMFPGRLSVRFEVHFEVKIDLK